MSALGCQKLDLMSALGSIFNCCTALGKNLGVEPPVTLIKEVPQAHTARLGDYSFEFNLCTLPKVENRLRLATDKIQRNDYQDWQCR